MEEWTRLHCYGTGRAPFQQAVVFVFPKGNVLKFGMFFCSLWVYSSSPVLATAYAEEKLCGKKPSAEGEKDAKCQVPPETFAVCVCVLLSCESKMSVCS